MRQRLRASSAHARVRYVVSGNSCSLDARDTSNLPPAPLEPAAPGPSAPLPPYRIQVGDVLIGPAAAEPGIE